MANRRDLHISIDGDAKGFDAACADAEAKARGLDRELGKLERQQAAQEKVTSRTTAAVDRFAKSQDRAALAAHKLGLEAKRAAEQAEKAEVRAAAAAEAATKGLLDEEKATRLAARADDQIERASIKAAEAQIAQAAAAKKLADEERKSAESADKQKSSAEGMRGGLVSAGVAAAALSVPLAAAGLAAIGFAAVAAPAIHKVIAAQTDMAGQWDSLDSGQKVAASSVQALVNDYKALAKSYEPDVLAEFNGLVSTTRGLLPTLDKTVATTRVGFMSFSTTVENSLNRQVPRLAGILQGQANPALQELGSTFDHTASLAVNLVQGLAPMGMTLLHSSNGVLGLLNALTSIDPHLTEFAATALALRGPTTKLSELWTKGATALSGWGEKTAEAEGKVGKLAAGAGKAEGIMGKLGKVVGSSPSLYIGAALAAVYLATRLSQAGDATDHLISSVRTENNAIGNNIAGHQAAAHSLSQYIAQARAAEQADTSGAGAINEKQRITTVYNGQIQKLTAARKAELAAVSNITAGEKDLQQQYGGSAEQANQLATAAGVDLSKGITGSGAAAQAAQAKIRAYSNAVAQAQDPTRVVSDALLAAGNKALALKDRMTALTNAFSALAGPELAAFDAATKTADGFDQLGAALKKSHGSMSLSTAAGRTSRDAFVGLLGTVEQNIQAQYQFDSATMGAAVAQKNAAARARALLPILLAEAGNSHQARDAVLAWANAHGVGKDAAEALAAAMGTTKDQFIAAARQAGVSKKAAEDLWNSFKKLSNQPAILRLEDKDFLSKLHNAQGLKVDPKTGYLLGNNADYFNSWLKANGLRINPKTGLFKGNNADYYNKWLKANGLRIDTKTGQIKGNTAPFWDSVHSIPPVVGHRSVTVTYSYQGSAGGNKILTPAQNRADGGIDRYAAGGLRRDLDPMVVARPTVLFGETQTGGEAYIPLGAAKRKRSVMLLSDVAGLFGMQLVKPMADGGMLQAFADGGTTASVSLSDALQHWTDTKSPTTKKDVDAATKARKTQINQLKAAEDSLYRARHAHHKDARTIAADERRVAAERSDVADATKKLADVEARYKYGKLSPANQLGSALALDIKDTGAFIANLTTLANRGFGVLAQHLLAQGDATAEKTAADAVKMSTSKLSGLQKQVQQADQQQTTLANLGSILTIKTAMQGGANTWDTLLTATGLAPNDLAATLKLMTPDLQKTAVGQALLAILKAHGFARGGPIAGPPGLDNVPLWGTAGEYVVPRGPALANRAALDAMTTGRSIHIPTSAARGGDGAFAGRSIVIHVHARDSQSALATAKATSHELGWMLKQGGA